MIYFIDTSAWIKFFIMEDGTREIQDFILMDAAKESGLKVWNPVDGQFEKAKSYSERNDLDKGV